LLAAWVLLPEKLADIVWAPAAEGVNFTEQLPALKLQVPLLNPPVPPPHDTVPEGLFVAEMRSVTFAVQVVDAWTTIFFGLHVIVVLVVSGPLVATGDAAD